MMRTLPKLVVMVNVTVASVGAMSAEAVDRSDKVKWVCEGDTSVALDQETGKLRISSKSAGVDETLPFYACHSSHCDWGPKETAAQCEFASCAEMLAIEQGQLLLIKLERLEQTCTAEK